MVNWKEDDMMDRYPDPNFCDYQAFASRLGSRRGRKNPAAVRRSHFYEVDMRGQHFTVFSRSCNQLSMRKTNSYVKPGETDQTAFGTLRMCQRTKNLWGAWILHK